MEREKKDLMGLNVCDADSAVLGAIDRVSLRHRVFVSVHRS